MKVVILAGGFGTRLSEETHRIPKPMVEIGGKPILWHIMKIYSTYGYNDFIICLGYKGYIIKEYFANYFLHNSDVTIDLKTNEIEVHNNYSEPWRVTLVDTGLHTQTGGRIKRVAKYIGDETFMMTYGDGVGNINIRELVEFHKKHGKLATVTAVQPEGRFGVLKLNGNQVIKFAEKMDNKDSWINAGFFVLEPEVIDYIKGDDTIWEKEPLERLAEDGQLMAYFHRGFWKPMDKLKDKMELEKLWNSGNAPWKIWKD
ncbi:glucose-1-phosphate cytidylyltransferase [Methanocaldococcus villosus KIN24-T80]|uniref:Glucose-1-phosphate cytidylyltransferase n=1 Tax=Methanocaldococcus villosus KIN24-T80 TaxID=1069083 RepID=N6UTW8_9EURY|nr:glucose-1-phosphate cytidylyltransferase [Methanocaldococcus villosus]ENN95794.1 glucose-1-phosphate cytidylyltransferase [Methanocaldococcus villosus KIN24-T80]